MILFDVVPLVPPAPPVAGSDHHNECVCVCVCVQQREEKCAIKKIKRKRENAPGSDDGSRIKGSLIAAELCTPIVISLSNFALLCTASATVRGAAGLLVVVVAELETDNRVSISGHIKRRKPTGALGCRV